MKVVRTIEKLGPSVKAWKGLDKGRRRLAMADIAVTCQDMFKGRFWSLQGFTTTTGLSMDGGCTPNI